MLLEKLKIVIQKVVDIKDNHKLIPSVKMQ
jgi:hypothetical protein